MSTDTYDADSLSDSDIRGVWFQQDPASRAVHVDCKLALHYSRTPMAREARQRIADHLNATSDARQVVADPRDEFLRDLPAGSVVRHSSGGDYLLKDDMKGDWAYVHRIKQDGTIDRRWRGWSGSLPTRLWSVVRIRED